MLDGFLADRVDTTLAIVCTLYSYTTAAVISELHDQLASL